jgi:hypothetical protein
VPKVCHRRGPQWRAACHGVCRGRMRSSFDAALHMTALMTKAAMMMRLDDGGDDDAGSTRSTTKSATIVDG